MRQVMAIEATDPSKNAKKQEQSRVKGAEGKTMMILTQAQSQSSWICHRETLLTRMRKTCASILDEKKNKLGRNNYTRSRKNKNALIR